MSIDCFGYLAFGSHSTSKSSVAELYLVKADHLISCPALPWPIRVLETQDRLWKSLSTVALRTWV